MASLLLVCAVACAGPPAAALTAADVRINKPLPGTRMSAGYLALTNNSDAEIRITSFDSPQFEAVELHATETTDGVARMRALPEIAILPGETVRLAPGGIHLMLMGPLLPLERVTLNFYAGEDLLLSATSDAKDP